MRNFFPAYARIHTDSTCAIGPHLGGENITNFSPFILFTVVCFHFVSSRFARDTQYLLSRSFHVVFNYVTQVGAIHKYSNVYDLCARRLGKVRENVP